MVAAKRRNGFHVPIVHRTAHARRDAVRPPASVVPTPMSMSSLDSALQPQGFHFTVSTSCALHVLHDLGPDVYADEYELAQRPDYTTALWGLSDLERPLSAVPPDGTVLLLTAGLRPGSSVTLDVPLHARYATPVSGDSAAYHTARLRRPLGFLSCPLDKPAPVPDALLSYVSLPGWPTGSLALIHDAAPRDPLEVTVPVGVLEDLKWVDVGTAAVMLAAFFYLLASATRTARRLAAKSSTKTD
ncbi:uncharacterized protein BXZ73DRAFT_95906 [Epithele typhae]|uniref:uncharacterized protein n=1 Tax=Epithele typhae TaxID=378194 RepID=UPI002007442F|nr:uncharacterized protein BXZ73DRAFT_95906 [Epithele typhae]KAH9946408.1 hypothetical protein BXZ73DRAFT_95906 [Epithele typhae]